MIYSIVYYIVYIILNYSLYIKYMLYLTYIEYSIVSDGQDRDNLSAILDRLI